MLLVILGVAFVVQMPELSPIDSSTDSSSPSEINGCITINPQNPSASTPSTTNNNCVINSYSMLNQFNFPDEIGISIESLRALTRRITDCYKRKTGRNPVVEGVPVGQTGSVLECKKEVMEGEYGIEVNLMSIFPFKDPFSFLLISGLTETLRTHRNPYGGSPFAGDCPQPGAFVIELRDTTGTLPGHSVMCIMTEEDYCLENGAASFICIEHPDQGGGLYHMTVNSGGYVSVSSGVATPLLVTSYTQ